MLFPQLPNFDIGQIITGLTNKIGNTANQAIDKLLPPKKVYVDFRNPLSPTPTMAAEPTVLGDVSQPEQIIRSGNINPVKPTPTPFTWNGTELPRTKPTASPTAVPSPTPTPYPKEQMGRNPNIAKYKPQPVVVDAIVKAAKQYNMDPSILFDIAMQESSFRANADPYKEGRGEEYAKAGYPKGLFQFTDGTWSTVQNYANMPNSTLQLPNTDRFDPYSSALAAAYLIAHGQLGRWDASKNVWGPYYTEQELAPYYSQRAQ
jgi:hypothetical protein